MTCVFGELVDGDFRLIVVINCSLMIINFVMDTGGHSQQKMLRNDVQGKVNCLSGFVSFLLFISSVFVLFLLNRSILTPIFFPFKCTVYFTDGLLYTANRGVSIHAFYSDVPRSSLDTGTGCPDGFVVAF
jgi:hypothetical protein